MGMTVFAFLTGLVFGALIMFLNSRGKDREIALMKETQEGALAQQKASFETAIHELKQSHETALAQQKTLLEARIQDNLANETKIKDQFSLLATEILNKNLEAQTKAIQGKESAVQRFYIQQFVLHGHPDQ